MTSLFNRLSTPLRAIEYIVCFLVIGSAFLAVLETLTDEPLERGAGLSFRLLIDQYNIIAYILVAMAAAAFIDIISLVASPRTDVKYRAVTTFIIAIGYFFVGSLALSTLGFDHLLWINDFALAAVSAILYISIKATASNEYFN